MSIQTKVTSVIPLIPQLMPQRINMPFTNKMIVIGVSALLLLLLFTYFFFNKTSKDIISPSKIASVEVQKSNKALKLTQTQWSTLTVSKVETTAFRDQVVTEGKISLNEDHTTPVFSPYTGRVIKLLVKPGDKVEQYQPLFVVEAADVIQTLKDYVAASTNLSKAEAHLRLMEAAFTRSKDLYNESATSQKDYEQAEDNKISAQNDLQAAQSSLEAARDRLRILGKTNDDIEKLDKLGNITSETVITAPISGTIVQRKIGPGQYVTSGSADPVFSIGDLSNVWLIANVKETDTAKVKVGQLVNFSVLSNTQNIFSCWINYVAPSIDPVTRRLLVRAEVDNTNGILRPEMFANVHIITSNEENSPAIPRDAIIYQGSEAHVWAVKEDTVVELRVIKTGLVSNGLVQVLEGLAAGDRIISKGALFVDKISSASD
ncbi:MAG: efflux RND transporter periplasmic adaptor subunit [Hyphomicrobium sp.]